jgi:hypothetical protein
VSCMQRKAALSSWLKPKLRPQVWFLEGLCRAGGGLFEG